MSNPYSDDFLLVLAKWQCGWHEEKSKRIQITGELECLLRENHSKFPSWAFEAPSVCFRKRFLVPNNPQNGGDFFPFVWDGEIVEGAASWTTDYRFAKSIFKNEIRENEISVIFFHNPTPTDVVLNISRIWEDENFVNAAKKYVEQKKEFCDVFTRIGNKQKEVILRASLSIDRVKAFCGLVPLLDDICKSVGLSNESDIDRIWEGMKSREVYPFDRYWIEDHAVEAALNRFLAVIAERWEQRGWIRRHTR